MNFFRLKYFYLLACIGLLSCNSVTQYDVVIVGGGASGTAAGLQAARMGVRTLIVEEFDWLGGMLTSAGVSATDGNYQLRGGIWDEFRTEMAQHYGSDSALITGWVSNFMFEPSVGDSVFKQMAARESNLTVWYRSTATVIEREKNSWRLEILRGARPQQIKAKIVIDATELGDVARQLGVAYDVGMDSAGDTDEEIAPAESNLIVQDLTYVAVLKDYGHDVTIPIPDGYDPSLFACCSVNDLCISPKEPHRMWSREMMITYGKLSNGKYMINWPIEGNDYFVDMIDMTPQERADAILKAKNHTLSFVYFLQHELGFQTLGLADDEFPTEDRLPFIPYHRESRRIHGVVRFTLNDITDPYAGTLYRTAVGVGDYPVDQHHTRYSGWEELPDLYFHPIPSYGFPLGIIIPVEHPGLLVAEKSVSVTNIVNGSSRLQPVVLQIGQATGALAALAVTGGVDVSEVPIRSVQSALLDAGGYLLPYLDLPASDPRFKAMQRIGVTGIIKGRGANIGWENQTWFDAEKSITEAELRRGLNEVYPAVELNNRQTPVDGELLIVMLSETLGKPTGEITQSIDRVVTELLNDYNVSHPLTRLECAQLIDAIADPFHCEQVNIYGKYNHEKQ